MWVSFACPNEQQRKQRTVASSQKYDFSTKLVQLSFRKLSQCILKIKKEEDSIGKCKYMMFSVRFMAFSGRKTVVYEVHLPKNCFWAECWAKNLETLRIFPLNNMQPIADGHVATKARIDGENSRQTLIPKVLFSLKPLNLHFEAVAHSLSLKRDTYL